jgi:hypothetical protein
MASGYYSGDPATSDKDAVRFLIGDTGPDTFHFSDPEIEYLVSTQGNIYLAAAMACDKITTLLTSGGLVLTSKSVGGLSESYSQGSLTYYQTQGKLYRQMGSGSQVPVAACIPQLFSIGQFDSPGVRDPALRHRGTSWRSEEEV